MTQEPKPGKRIVSRGEYAWLQSKTAGIFASGIVLWTAALICGTITLVASIALPVVIIEGFFSHEPLAYVATIAGCVLFAGVFAALTYTLGKWACKGLEYDGVKNAVPIHRANTDAMPANESLVRASSEPPQEQQAMLLRSASGEAQNSQGDQLLRASVGE